VTSRTKQHDINRTRAARTGKSAGEVGVHYGDHQGGQVFDGLGELHDVEFGGGGRRHCGGCGARSDKYGKSKRNNLKYE
jgi:hypothetical protein